MKFILLSILLILFTGTARAELPKDLRRQLNNTRRSQSADCQNFKASVDGIILGSEPEDFAIADKDIEKAIDLLKKSPRLSVADHDLRLKAKAALDESTIHDIILPGDRCTSTQLALTYGLLNALKKSQNETQLAVVMQTIKSFIIDVNQETLFTIASDTRLIARMAADGLIKLDKAQSRALHSLRIDVRNFANKLQDNPNKVATIKIELENSKTYRLRLAQLIEKSSANELIKP